MLLPANRKRSQTDGLPLTGRLIAGHILPFRGDIASLVQQCPKRCSMVLEIKNKIPETSAILGSKGHLTVFDQKISSLDKPPAEQ